MPDILTSTTAQSSIVLTNALASTALIDLSQYKTAQLSLPTGYASTTLTVHAQVGRGEWLPLRDDTNTAVVLTVAAGMVRNLPPSCLVCDRIKLVTNNAGDNAVSVGLLRKT